MSRIAATRLRDATSDVHQALDTGFDVVRRLSNPDSRSVLLRGYRRLHETVETATAPYLHSLPGLEFAARRRAAAIPAPSAGALPLPIGSRAEALGAFYVIEGSTLGARVILKAVRERGSDTESLGFLDFYGARAGGMWRALLEVLERELASDEQALAAAVEGAKRTFELAEMCLAA